MSKTNLIKEAEALIADVDKTHRYSMSKIYGLYNRVFETKETPQSCASCLIRKVNELRKWLESEKLKELERSIGSTSTTVGNYEEVKAENENTYLTEEMKNKILEAEKPIEEIQPIERKPKRERRVKQ